MKHQNVEGQKIKTFNFLKVLGSGAWAVVYQAYDEKTYSTVAVKAIPKSLMKQTPKLQQLVRTQIKVLRECHNDNVIKFVDSFGSQRTQFIAMEYCNGGDLEKYLEKKKRLTEDEATNFLKQILNGFRGLHEVNAMHRDFKVANVLLHEGVCKIADLGFAKQMEKKKMTQTILGTSLTMAPEVLRQQSYGMEADIWSIGVVYYQLLYGKYPFSGMSDADILKKIETTRPDYSGVNISAKARDFLDRCMTDSTIKRIAWRDVYNHQLIKSSEKMIYGLTSRINFKQNEEFYQKNVKINDDYIYAEKKEFHKKPSSQDMIFQASNKVDMDKLKKEAELKKKISAAVQRYQKLYLNYRNNIMFIYKFVTPYTYTIADINANHGITLFILSKNAYHQMKNFHSYVKGRTNFLKLSEYFNEFVNTQKYQTLVEMTQSDLEMIQAQMFCYQQDIGYCNKQIENQFDLDVIRSKNWNKLINQTITSYQFQLGDALDRFKGDKKLILLKIIEALIYYKQNAEKADIESFDRKIETLDFQMEESRIRDRLKAILQGK